MWEGLQQEQYSVLLLVMRKGYGLPSAWRARLLGAVSHVTHSSSAQRLRVLMLLGGAAMPLQQSR